MDWAALRNGDQTAKPDGVPGRRSGSGIGKIQRSSDRRNSGSGPSSGSGGARQTDENEGCKLFVSGVGRAKGTTQVEMSATFSAHGRVLRVDMPHGKDYSFVVMGSRDEAGSAIAALDGRPMLGAQHVRISLSNSGDGNSGGRRGSHDAGRRAQMPTIGQTGFVQEWTLWYNPPAAAGTAWAPETVGEIKDPASQMKVTALPPRPLPPLGSLLLFQSGLKPSWDEPASEGGGRVVISMRREESEQVWSDLMAAALLQRFSFERLVLGVAFSRRAATSKWDTLAIWTVALTGRPPATLVTEVRRELNLRNYVKVDYAYHQPPSTDNGGADDSNRVITSSEAAARVQRPSSQLLRGRRNSMPSTGALPQGVGVLAKGPEPGNRGFEMQRSPSRSVHPVVETHPKGSRQKVSTNGPKKSLALVLPENWPRADGASEFDAPLLSPVIELPSPAPCASPSPARSVGTLPTEKTSSFSKHAPPSIRPSLRRQRSLSSPSVRTPRSQISSATLPMAVTIGTRERTRPIEQQKDDKRFRNGLVLLSIIVVAVAWLTMNSKVSK